MSTASQTVETTCGKEGANGFCARLAGALARAPVNTWLAMAVLVLVNIVCFHRTINAYFLADDFIHVAYLAQVCGGQPQLLIENFHSNWMQTQGTQFYRPLVSLTLALDYMLGRSSPLPFHVTNLLLHTLASIGLFLAGRRLLGQYGQQWSSTAALIAALLFAAHPLHPEVVSWVIGRVDSLCAAFYLLSFWLFLRWQQDGCRTSLLASLACFVASLLSKEMAVTLPPTLFLAALGTGEGGLKARAIRAARATAGYWIVLLAYLGVRTVALGTIAGGYTGSIGEGLSSSILKRFFQDGAFNRLLFPLNAEVFPAGDRLRKWLRALYITIACLIALRAAVLRGKAGFSPWIGFALAWFVLAIIPTYQVFNLTDSLQGSRFLYLASAPLCLLITLAVLPLARERQQGIPARLATAAALILLVAAIALYAAITYRNNLPWAHASKEVRALRDEIEQAIAALPQEKTLALIDVPQRRQGAHMIYNASMLGILLRPPLSPRDLASRVATFEPMTYGEPDLIIASRLRRMLAEPEKWRFVSWDRDRQRLKDLPLSASDREIEFKQADLPLDEHGATPRSIVSPDLSLPSTASDFVEVEASTQGPARGRLEAGHIFLSWESKSGSGFFQGSIALPVEADGRYHLYRFPVSERKIWIKSGTIARIRLDLPPPPLVTRLKSVRLVNGKNLIPRLAADPTTASEDADGAVRLGGRPLRLDYDATAVAGAQSLFCEFTRPNAWFEHYSGHCHDARPCESALKRIELPGLKGSLLLSSSDFPASAFYQVRVMARRADGSTAGYSSDPLNLQVATGPPR